MDSHLPASQTHKSSETIHDFNFSEVDTLSDSDWLDISSREDNDSIGNPESDRDEVSDRPLSRRSFSSHSSSRDGDVEAWEGLVEGADADADDGSSVEPILHALDAELPSVPDLAESSAEEQRVKEALDQSMISTLSSSRTSSLGSSTHVPTSRPRDLRLSFPDPLTSSHDDLNQSYEDISPISSDLHVVFDDGEHQVDISESHSPLEDPGLSSTPEVLPMAELPQIDFQVILYGSPNSSKWQFVEKLLNKLALGSGLVLSSPDAQLMRASIYCLKPKGCARRLTPGYNVSVIDGVLPRSDNPSVLPASKTLAIVFFPSSLSHLPPHTLYLPVIASSSMVSDDPTGLSKDFLRRTVEHKWDDLGVPLSQLLLINLEHPSAVIDEDEIETLEPSEVAVGFQRLLPHSRRLLNVRALRGQLSSVPAMTVLGILSIVLAYIVSGMSSTSVPVIPQLEKHYPTPVLDIPSNVSNQSSASPSTTPISTALGASSLKDFALAIFSPLPSDSPNAARLSQVSSAPGTPADTHIRPSSQDTEDMPTVDGGASSMHSLSRPITSSVSLTGTPGSKAVSIFHEAAGQCITNLPSPTAESLHSLSRRLTSSLSNIFSLRFFARAIGIEMKHIFAVLDQLIQSLEEQTATAKRLSKAVTGGLREQLHLRNRRAQERALALRKKGEWVMTTVGEKAVGRFEQARSKAKEFKAMVSSEVATVYQKQWTEGFRSIFVDHHHSRRGKRVFRREMRRVMRGRFDLWQDLALFAAVRPEYVLSFPPSPSHHHLESRMRCRLVTVVLGIGLLWLECVTAAQQCRLRVSGEDIGVNGPPPGSTASGGSSVLHASATAAVSSASSSPSPSALPAFQYGKVPVRGVNLGGWFVLEPWITPSIFNNTNNTAIVDEYTLGQLLNADVALQMLNTHWDTWIIESDFAAIAAAGLTHVRIPVGYWSVPTNDSVEPYIPGAWPYLLRALQWANKYSIHVVLDLHGAPGSQNGYDNSGQRTDNPVWALNPANVTRTLDVLSVIASEVGGMVDTIELLNEAAGFLTPSWASTVRSFWQDGYYAVRNETGGNVKVMIGDAFLGVQSWTDFMTSPNFQGVLMDYHDYQIFSVPELSRSQDEHISFACTLLPTLQSFANSNLWTITGEWSAAITDCALWLNGRGVGSRWDGTYSSAPALGSCDGYTGNSSTFSSSYKAFLRKYWEVQVEIGESVQGWIYWTWKAENADEWSYQKGLEGGWIPMDPSQRLYPGLCSGNATNSTGS
ncbi:hypothetical protein EW146_g6094 [Bondarzewia mesenterica]|uniref:Glycoside hydrolase family 5 domain-containing protein n=1 Tax=Bondarzewia mesenterica TaxID=1095465 RepID=A0A4S4LRF7_9AGAM|nr:hypothetical protein EW146_g6094 [Bondarzewia mesenterica]